MAEVSHIYGDLSIYSFCCFRPRRYGLQRKYNYPKYFDHKKLHDAFVKDIQSMKADVEQNGVTVATGPMMGATLANWLLSHINVHDKALGQYLQSQVSVP